MSLADDDRVREALLPLASLRTIEVYDRVTSTNDVARQRLVEGARPGLVVVADRQSAGRGRAGRRWIDDLKGPDGPANLAVTATIRLPPAPGLLPLVAGLAVADTFDAAGASSVLKWPNDVLLEGRKAAGILVEGHRICGRDVALIGCGLDLDWRGVARTGERAGWVSLAEVLDEDVDRAVVLGRLLAALDLRLDQHARRPGATLASYRPRCATLGQHVRVQRPGGAVTVGVAVDLDADGRLVVDAAGRRIPVQTGDVHRIRPPSAQDTP